MLARTQKEERGGRTGGFSRRNALDRFMPMPFLWDFQKIILHLSAPGPLSAKEKQPHLVWLHLRDSVRVDETLHITAL